MKDKARSWLYYVASAAAKLKCDVWLIVIAHDASVAAWAKTAMHNFHPGSNFAPLVYDMSAVPKVKDPTEAKQKPGLALLSAAAHCQALDAEEIFLAALSACFTFSEETQVLYSNLLLAMADKKLQKKLEATMNSTEPTLMSNVAKRHYKKGKTEGVAEGKAQTLLQLFSLRNIAVSDEQREKILACQDLNTLSDWVGRALTAQRVEEIF